MDLLSRAVFLAQDTAGRVSSSIVALASSLSTAPPPRPRSPPPYTGPDRLSGLTHDLHALIFTFLPLRSLFAASRLSSTFSSLPSHPVCDELYRHQLWDPARPSACTDRLAGESWRSYIRRVVDEEQRLVGDTASGVKFEIGGCDDRVKGPRMFVSLQRHAWVANYDPALPHRWAYEDSPDAVFEQSLLLRNVAWLEIHCLLQLPTPPSLTSSPYRYRVFVRLAVSERSNLGSPVFSVRPHDDDAPYATMAERVVHNHQLKDLIRDKESVVTGVGGLEGGAAEPRPAQVEEVWRPRNQAEALMGRRGGMRRVGQRRRSLEGADRGIRPERVMRELLIGEVEVRAKDWAHWAREETTLEADEKGEKGESEEEKKRREEEPLADAVRMRVSVVKKGPEEGWKSGVAFDCIIAERIPW